MGGVLTRALRHTVMYHAVRRLVNSRRQAQELARWERQGSTGPVPHLLKQKVLLEYARAYDLRVFVETGTFYGDMVAAMKPHFDEVYSIELSRELYESVRHRFKRDGHVRLVHGDSGRALGGIVPLIRRPALFWLDGHFSAGVTARGDKDTPIYEELTHILAAEEFPHVAVIDDARCFGRDSGYPTIRQLLDFIGARRPELTIEIQHDSIRITPARIGATPVSAPPEHR
jgi:hypothetical protein